jgi:hypothetical protein
MRDHHVAVPATHGGQRASRQSLEPSAAEVAWSRGRPHAFHPLGHYPDLPGRRMMGYALHTDTAADGSEHMAETTSVLATVSSVDAGRATREALAEMTAAWRSIEAARRHASEYHRHAGSGDAHLVRAVALLRREGHHDLADTMCNRLIGHGVTEDRWAFPGIEEDEFFRTLMTLEEQVRSRSRPTAPVGSEGGVTDPEG